MGPQARFMTHMTGGLSSAEVRHRGPALGRRAALWRLLTSDRQTAPNTVVVRGLEFRPIATKYEGRYGEHCYWHGVVNLHVRYMYVTTLLIQKP
jgi:hypothetical protein